MTWSISKNNINAHTHPYSYLHCSCQWHERPINLLNIIQSPHFIIQWTPTHEPEFALICCATVPCSRTPRGQTWDGMGWDGGKIIRKYKNK